MPAPQDKSIQPDFTTWAELVCPVCLQSLRFEQTRVLCTACNRTYPIVDGIPVLIADRALNPPTK
jgi:uncharacterized protein YbaR (Trm112 family)